MKACIASVAKDGYDLLRREYTPTTPDLLPDFGPESDFFPGPIPEGEVTTIC